MEQGSRVKAEILKRFCIEVFKALDVCQEDAKIAADVLVEADLRGIDSHGVAHLRRLYADRIREGKVAARPQVRVVAESATTAVLDGGAGLGHPVAYRAMEMAIQKAQASGAGFVTVRNSNHYGIAGYYATMALAHDCVGISMTNSGPIVTPTFGRDGVLGTNPIAVAAPAGQERPFVLDMATSTVAHGKLEIHSRSGKPLPEGWVVDGRGASITDPDQAMANRRRQAGGGLLPLGGAGESTGGYKGYGLALWVEIFCALLSGATTPYVSYRAAQAGAPYSVEMSHFFGAWRVDRFRPLDEFKAEMDRLQRHLKEATKAAGQTRIYIPGEKEFEAKERRCRDGIPLDPEVLADLRALADEVGIALQGWRGVDV